MSPSSDAPDHKASAAQPQQDHAAWRRVSPDSFNKIAGGAYALVATAAIVVGGVWALSRFSLLLEARIAKATVEAKEAEVRKTIADAVAAARSAESTVVVNVDLSAGAVLAPGRSDLWWVIVELSVKNTGNSPHRISLEDDVRFYIARIVGVARSGELEYVEKKKLAFDYPDKRLTWFTLQPGAEIDRFRTVQTVTTPGLYIARFSAKAPREGDKVGREFSAQTFFVVRKRESKHES